MAVDKAFAITIQAPRGEAVGVAEGLAREGEKEQ